MHLLYKHLLGSGYTSWALKVIQKDYMGSPVYDKEAEVYYCYYYSFSHNNDMVDTKGRAYRDTT